MWIFYVFVLSCVCYVLCASVYMCFVVTCWERADLLALVCGVFCEFVTFPLVSWVRCGTWLYRFLIFATLLTLNSKSLIYKGDSFLYFLNVFQKCYILTEFFLSFLCFSYFWIKTKHQIRLLALGFEPRHTSRCLHIITWGCSANWTKLTCQNLSFLRKVCKIWNETQLVSWVCDLANFLTN